MGDINMIIIEFFLELLRLLNFNQSLCLGETGPRATLVEIIEGIMTLF